MAACTRSCSTCRRRGTGEELVVGGGWRVADAPSAARRTRDRLSYRAMHAPRGSRAAAYAPGGIGNLGPGLDVLGCAVTGAGDVVELEWRDERCDGLVRIEEPGHPDLPREPTRHAAAIAAMSVLRVARTKTRSCVVMRARKGLPDRKSVV